MIGIKPSTIRKAWSMVGHPPEGPTVFRNPPPTAFAPANQPDIPAFAHNGRGATIPGEFSVQNGIMQYNTDEGAFFHGIDALAMRLGSFFRKLGINASPVEVINAAIKQFNDTHISDNHQIPSFDSLAWRKIRANVLPPGVNTRSESERPTKTHNNTLITTYTNKNADKTPLGRFIESYSIPFNQQLQHILEDEFKIPRDIWREMKSGVLYPYLYARHTAPQGWIQSSAQEHPSALTPDMVGRAPEGRYSSSTPVHTWETTHHLPNVMYYPAVNEKMQKTGKQHSWEHKQGLYNRAEKFITEALAQGLEHIPNVPITLNQGTLANPDMIQRPLPEVLQTPELRRKLIEDMAHAPALMYLFGRSGQGNFNKQFNNLLQVYGLGEDGISFDDHKRYFKAGQSGGDGMHLSAVRMMGLARKSGMDAEDDSRSNLSTHDINSEELNAMGFHYSDNLLEQVDRYRNIIEALADHQASARGHNVKMGLGDIPTEPMMGYDIHGFPMEGDDIALDPHMDAYLHSIHDFAPTTALPQREEVPSPAGEVTSTTTPINQQPQVTPPVSVSQQQLSGRAPPQMLPLPTSFQQVRPQIAALDPARFRQLTRRDFMPNMPAELTPVEQRAQMGLADPRQTLLTQFMAKGEDEHLPVMDRIMKGLEKVQFQNATIDDEITKFNSKSNFIEHVGLSENDINSINQTMGDWDKVAKAYNVKSNIVKVIKVNMGR